MPALHLLVPARQARKRALCVGIKYTDFAKAYDLPDFELRGTHNDPFIIRKLLIEYYGFDPDNIEMLLDDEHHTNPTRNNLLLAMEDLVKDARPGDHLVFAFSGHGSQTENYDGTELDGKDELIWPCDVEYDGYEDENDQPVMSNYIKDDELKEILVDSLPQGVHFTAILDACHSGTGLDLPNEFSDESVSSILSPISPSQDPQSVFAAGIPSVKAKGLGPLNMNYAMHGTAEDDIPRFCNTPDSPAFDLPSTMAVLETRSVTSWSACSDRQIVLENGKGGILVQAFAKELPTFIEANGRHPTHRELLERLSQALLKSAREARRKLLESIECPKPQLGGLRKIEVILDEEFTF